LLLAQGRFQESQRSFLRTVPPEVARSGTETCRDIRVSLTFTAVVVLKDPRRKHQCIPSRALSLPLQARCKDPAERLAPVLAYFNPHSLRSHPPGGSGGRARAKRGIPKATERSRTRPRLSMPVMGLTAILRVCVLRVVGFVGLGR
jgi:hypothetical protein